MDKYYLDTEKVEHFIRQTKKSYQEISERMGAGKSYMSNALKYGEISEKYLVRLAQELKVTPESLLDISRKGKAHQYKVDHSEMVKFDADLLKELIKKGGYDQNYLSQMIGREKSYISSCKKSGTIRLNALKEIADILGVDADTLLLKPEEPDEGVQLSFDDVPFLPDTVYRQDGRPLMAFSQCAKADIRQAMDNYIDTVLDALDKLEEVINEALKEVES